MKKLLIIQKDSPYFLLETLRLIERQRLGLKDFNISILVNEASLKDIQDAIAPIGATVLTKDSEALADTFDLSFNLSLEENTWDLHDKVKAVFKAGPSKHDKIFKVPDLWSTYFLTIKAKAPFLTFHLQDTFQNILGLKHIIPQEVRRITPTVIAYGMLDNSLMSGDEQEKLVSLINGAHPHITIKDVTEIDLFSDLSHAIYLGPPSLPAIKIGSDSFPGFYLCRNFEGFNLVSHQEKTVLLSSRGGKFQATDVFKLFEQHLNQAALQGVNTCSIYQVEQDHLFGAYLKSLNQSDDNYPFYQSHLVLWNFLLSMFDVNLDIIHCSEGQLALLQSQQEVLKKLIRLHEYAMVSIDIIYKESRSASANGEKIQGHLKNLGEIDQISDQISVSHSFLRPFLDFYRMRRGQNDGTTLTDQSSHSLLVYSEEHQALQALDELFSVTLKKNEVNI